MNFWQAELDYKFDEFLMADYDSLNMVLTGGAISLATYLRRPGSSNNVSEVVIPYSERAMDRFLGEPAKGRAVSIERLDQMITRAETLWVDEPFILVTAALSSNRYRHGDNHAYVAIGTHEEVRRYHIELRKPNEEAYNSLFTESFTLELREREDVMLSALVLSLLLYGLPDWKMYEGSDLIARCHEIR